MDTRPADIRPNQASIATKAGAVQLERVGKAYGPVWAVADVSFSIAPGEIIALVGHSGSGKSTLLRLIAGLEQPSGGRIAIAGRDVSAAGMFVPPERRGVGMMFQDYALFPHLTALENIRFGLAGKPRAEAKERSRAALEQVGLAARADAYPHMLSGGEQQRIALARALAPAPSVLLMDEPFSNLDRRTRDVVREETGALLRASGTTAILVTHDPEDAMRMTDRIMLMQAGRILQGGSAEDLYNRPASLLVARLFAEYNEIEAVCRGGMVDTALGRFPAHGIPEGGAVTVCLRPHDLALAEAGNVSGTLVSRAFVGDELVLSVTVPGLARPLQVRAPIHTRAVAGQSISLLFNADDVLVFPRDA